MKKLLPVLLALALVLTMAPASTSAEGEAVENARTFSFIGGTTTQEDIDAAWGEGAVSYTADIVEGETVYTIKLLKDINMAAGQDVRIGEYREDGSALPQMILDLNGCTITSSSIGLINYGDLIIRDTSDAKTGGITYSTTNDKSSLVAVSHKGGLLVIEGGTFICDSGYAFTGYSAAVSVQAGAAAEIKGGSFVGDSSALLSSGDTTVTGGTFTAPYGMYAKSADGVPGTIVVPEESTAVVNAESFAFVIQRDGETDGRISALGGTYNAPNVVGGVRQPDTAAAVSITGGTYTANPSGWVSENTAVASLKEAGSDSSSYIVGDNKIAAAAADASAGDTIQVLSGTVSLTDVADGVIVENAGGEVTVNGEPVTEENPVTVCNHVWNEPVWTWEADNSGATAVFTCKKDGTHTESMNAEISSVEENPATCTEMGVTAYTATVIFNDQKYTDTKKATDIAMIDHTYEDGKCTDCGAIDPDFKAQIIAGADSTWKKGSKEDLSFTSNAAFGYFQKVQVDGKDLDEKNYEVKEGSTVVTLKASYLETLTVGEHTLAVLSDTGTAETTFTVQAADETTKPSQDGDSGNLLLWIALLVVSGGALSLAIYGKKKRASVTK